MPEREVIACKVLPETKARIEEYADQVRDAAHTIGTHGMSEQEFKDSGLFHAAIERLRGQQAASMTTKRAFVADVLDHMQSVGSIASWNSTGSSDRHDYEVRVPSGRVAVVEAKGCLDGNNTNIFVRPANADEFLIWSLCQNPGADPRKNVWSGIHTRLSAEVAARRELVDGLIVWDMLCGTIGRPCPKLVADPDRATTIKHRSVPPPCIYLFPRTIANARNNAQPPIHSLDSVEFLKALYQTFKCGPDDVAEASFEVRMSGNDVERRTTLTRNGVVVETSAWTELRRAT
jgi:hypothetical protein